MTGLCGTRVRSACTSEYTRVHEPQLWMKLKSSHGASCQKYELAYEPVGWYVMSCVAPASRMPRAYSFQMSS